MKNEYINEEKECDIILSFIEDWQNHNIYVPAKLEEHNAKFRKDLKAFFESNNFKHLTLDWVLS